MRENNPLSYWVAKKDRLTLEMKIVDVNFARAKVKLRRDLMGVFESEPLEL